MGTRAVQRADAATTWCAVGLCREDAHPGGWSCGPAEDLVNLGDRHVTPSGENPPVVRTHDRKSVSP